MPLPDPADWSDLLRQALGPTTSRSCARSPRRLVRTRNQWPADELIDRAAATVVNAAVIDRRLQDLDPAARQLLALVAAVPPAALAPRQPRRAGHRPRPARGAVPADPGPASRTACSTPSLRRWGSASRLKSFEQLLAWPARGGLAVFAHPAVAARALGEDLGPAGTARGAASGRRSLREADGLEWLLRLSVLWQLVGGRAAAADAGRRLLQARPRPAARRRRAQRPAGRQPGRPARPGPARGRAGRGGRDRAATATANSAPARCRPRGTTGCRAALESLCAGLFRLESWDPQDGFRMAAEGDRQPVPVGLPARSGAARPAAGRTPSSPPTSWRRGCGRITRTGHRRIAPPVAPAQLGRHVPAGRCSSRCGWCRRRRTRPGPGRCACRRLAAGCWGWARCPQRRPPFRRRCWCSPTSKSSPTARG